MTIYRVDEHALTHTCPGNPESHPYNTVRTLVSAIPGPPCLTPVTIRCADTVVTLPCSRRLPHDRQCKNCRPILTIGQSSSHYTGYDDPVPATVPGGLAAEPCTACGEPLAAILARHGRHLLCGPARRTPATRKAG